MDEYRSRNWPVTFHPPPQDTGILDIPHCLLPLETSQSSPPAGPTGQLTHEWRPFKCSKIFSTPGVVGLWQGPGLTHKGHSIPLESSVLPSKCPGATLMP